MESRLIEILLIIIGLIFLYILLSKLLSIVNKITKPPAKVHTKNLQGFGYLRNKVIFLVIVLICLISIFVVFIKAFYTSLF